MSSMRVKPLFLLRFKILMGVAPSLSIASIASIARCTLHVARCTLLANVLTLCREIRTFSAIVRGTVRSSKLRRVFFALVAVLALGMVAYAVPFRDRCYDPSVGESTRVAATRVGSGCVLYMQSGEVTLRPEQCARLTCEPGLIQVVGRASAPALFGLVAAYLAATLLYAFRWRALLAVSGVKLSVSELWRVSTLAQMGGVLLPGGVGGDALRIVSAKERGVPTGVAAATIVLDRFIGLATLSALALALALAMGAAWSPMLVLLFGIAFGVPLALLLVVFVARRWGGQSLGRFERLRTLVDYLGTEGAGRHAARAFAWSFVVSASQLLIVRAIVVALGEQPKVEGWVYAGTAVSMMVSALPGLPQGWGTTDVAYVYFLDKAGIAAAGALCVCLSYRLLYYVYVLVAVGLHAVSGGRRPVR
jgi:uncharacterized membrane protein YbhN (UPF0104 family)